MSSFGKINSAVTWVIIFVSSITYLLFEESNKFGSLFWIFIVAIFILLRSVLWLYQNRPIEQSTKVSLVGNFAAIAVGVISLVITINADRSNLYSSLEANRNATIGLMNENRMQDVCEFNNTIVNDIVQLIAKVSLATQYEIGIPNECFNRFDGSNFEISNPYVLPVYEQRRLN